MAKSEKAIRGAENAIRHRVLAMRKLLAECDSVLEQLEDELNDDDKRTKGRDPGTVARPPAGTRARG